MWGRRACPIKLASSGRAMYGSYCSTKKVIAAHREPTPTTTTSQLHRPLLHPRHLQNGGRSPTSAATEASKRPIDPHSGAKILEFLHFGAPPRPFAALVARDIDFDTAVPTLEFTVSAAGTLCRDYGTASANLFFQNAQGSQDHLAL